MSDSIFIGGGGPDHKAAQSLLLARANRHGLVAGATGTGKTVTLQTMAEQFSAAGVPVFCADVKGDLSGICVAGDPASKTSEKLNARAADIGMPPIVFGAAPCVFWDIYGRRGHPIRATISEMGPQLLARLLDLNDTQEGVLTIAFQYADDNDLLLLDFKDLRSLLAHISSIAPDVQKTYGNVAAASVGAVQRQLLMLEREGAPQFFGEPALELADFMKLAPDGRGYINILDATTLINSPRLYSTFLLWLLAELFEQLPEVGDPDKPKLVFFFDEAHLLFNDAPKALTDKIEQVVRLIRSKGVGVYFVTQNPRDLPESVLAQLGCRIQHALRAYTPTERKGVKAAAQSFRPNPNIDTEAAITELGTGEALVSTLDLKGAPTVVERTLIRPPSSRLGPSTDPERAAVQALSPVAGKYDTAIDRESAYERLNAREAQAAKAADDIAKQKQADAAQKKADAEAAAAAKARKAQVGYNPYDQSLPKQPPLKPQGRAPVRKSTRQTPVEAATNTAMRTAARELTQFVFRGNLRGKEAVAGMCGKFTQMASWPEVHAFSQPLVASPEGAPVTVSTPMRMAKVIRLGENGKPELVSMRWGFSKHGGPASKIEHMHARGETVDAKPRFCDAFGERRGILLVETFNEAEELPDGKRKQWVIRPKDRKSIAIAVIWEDWEGDEGTMPTFVMITVPPNELIGRITDRMPAILEQKDWPVWIGEKDATFKEIKSLLQTYDDGGNWEMTPQGSPSRKSDAPKPKAKPQMDLF